MDSKIVGTEEQAKDLIQQLAHKKFLVRQEVETKLLSLGFKAIRPLAFSSFSSNAEIAFRSRKLLIEVGLSTKESEHDKVHLLLKGLVVAGHQDLMDIANQFQRKVNQYKISRVIRQIRSAGASIQKSQHLNGQAGVFRNQRMLVRGQMLSVGDNETAVKLPKFKKEMQKKTNPLVRADNRKQWIDEIFDQENPSEGKFTQFIQKRFEELSKLHQDRKKLALSRTGRNQFQRIVVNRNGAAVAAGNNQFLEVTIQPENRFTKPQLFSLFKNLPVKLDFRLEKIKITDRWMDVMESLLETQKVSSIHFEFCRFEKKMVARIDKIRNKHNSIAWDFRGRAMLGIRGLTTELPHQSGATIQEVSEDTGAKRGGLQARDIISKIDGIKIRSFSHLRLVVAAYQPGDTIDVEYQRNGEAKTTKVTLTEAQ